MPAIIDSRKAYLLKDDTADGRGHRVFRVPGFLSSRPLTRKRVLPPPLGSKGVDYQTHSLTGKGVRRPSSDEGTDTPVLYEYYNTSTVEGIRAKFKRTGKKRGLPSNIHISSTTV
jgi:hypothetical protein